MKIEIDKPIIPRFVADWVEKERTSSPIHKSFPRAVDLVNNDNDWRNWANEVGGSWSRILATAWVRGYGIEQEPLYYAKSKLTGQYLGNKDIGIGSCVQQPFWFFDKGHLQIEKLPKEAFKRVYGLDDTNADFEEVKG